MNIEQREHLVTRRRLLRQSFAFSALAALGSLPIAAAASPSSSTGANLLMIGDWGDDVDQIAQTRVLIFLRTRAPPAKSGRSPSLQPPATIVASS